jgi:hypothetical protein
MATGKDRGNVQFRRPLVKKNDAQAPPENFGSSPNLLGKKLSKNRLRGGIYKVL